jgi:hypothetical protein
MAEDKNRETPETHGRGAREMSESEIDRTLLESFPASDPPSWTLGTYHRGESADGDAPRPARRDLDEADDLVEPSTL